MLVRSFLLLCGLTLTACGGGGGGGGSSGMDDRLSNMNGNGENNNPTANPDMNGNEENPVPLVNSNSNDVTPRTVSLDNLAAFEHRRQQTTAPNGNPKQNRLPLSANALASVGEYRRSPHLSTIGADAAYRMDLSGQGITLGILGRGMDLSHPEFYNKVITYDQSTLYGGSDGYDSDEDHTTLVASFIAGAYNGPTLSGVGGGMMGVAYNANIDLIARPVGGYTDSTFAQIYGYFNARQTPVINISSGLSNTINRIPFFCSNVPDLTTNTISREPFTCSDDNLKNVRITDPNLSDLIRKAREINNANNNRDINFQLRYTPQINATDENGNPTIAADDLEDLTAFVNQNFPDVIQALRDNTESVFVYAAGNGDNRENSLNPTAQHPSLSSSLPVLVPELQDRFLVVVNADTNGIDSGSHRCGVTKAFCLGAPGEDILGATNILESDNDREYRSVSGTSFSAPLVTGAIGLLLEHFASQSMTSRQIAVRLLATANKNFASYNENEVGQGILDIEAALQPTGMTSLRTATPNGNGNALSLSRSTLTLPAPFGDALQHSGHTLTFFDSLDTAFLTPLNHHLRSGFTSTFDTFTSIDSTVSRETIAAKNSNVSRETILPKNSNVSRETSLSADASNPYFSLLNQRSFNHSLSTGNKAVNMVFSAVAPSAGNQQQSQWSVALRYKASPHTTATFGYADEGNQLLSGYGRHGFAFQPRHTLYGHIASAYRITPRADIALRAFTSHSRAAPQPNSLIRQLTPILSTAFDIRLTHRDTFTPQDRLSLQLKQPLKVEDGKMVLHYARWRNATRMLYQSQTLSLTPSSRSLHVTMHYETPIPMTTGTLSLSAAYLSNPNHSRYEANAWLGLLRFHVPL
ncbi:MAG: S8 family serine peptidase [Alphaproteobacteria bacterium GM202ARS2]|nr:S8 family serine peptidase [Alphaproteobacteria bacterium GM202ARS2]